MPNPLVIYHGKCPDGMTAAWAVRKALGDGDYVPASHGDAPPDVAGRDVVVVDFSYKRAVMETMAVQARSLLVLDHHKSAQADLAGLPYAIFDLERSGASMAWDWFHPGQARPALVNLVEDGDLWRHALPDTRKFQRRLEMESMDFINWDRIAGMSKQEFDGFIAEGDILKRAFDSEVVTLLEDCYPVTLGGETGLAVNASGRYSSELGHALAIKSGSFGMVWRQLNGALKISLRSCDDYDVALLAVKFGGGGHRNAASFTLPINIEGYTLLAGKTQS
ncbi:MAG: phosphohydrolase [Gallionella sp.]|jgi:oligoribonuclease NrnB/cAMP/cGMP phosphodiesterase (DHH superfamily)